MSNFNQLEIQNLKKLINYTDTLNQKVLNYVSFCTDPQIKQLLKKSAQDTLNYRQKLISLL